ncbi:hypothetical protein CDAR_46961 [Caerostris darwini]|uniref:Uncharacterized protein n=1 Tax=Caerostris darwini TaxID=1538125 RepID=A0AAV4SDX6_9ARAC|nr:hypothetical protein CDAR_46961 [Caerostris darwini]
MDDGHRGRPGPVVVRIADTTVDVLALTLLRRTEVGTAPVKTSQLPTAPVDCARSDYKRAPSERASFPMWRRAIKGPDGREGVSLFPVMIPGWSFMSGAFVALRVGLPFLV